MPEITRTLETSRYVTDLHHGNVESAGRQTPENTKQGCNVMKTVRAFVLTWFCITVSGPVLSQAVPRDRLPPRSAESARSLRIAERNVLGLLQYCQQAGLVSAEAIEQQRLNLAALSPTKDDATGVAEEAAGRLGVIAFEEGRTTFAGDAAAQGISVAYSCFQMALRTANRLGREPPK